MHQGQISLVQKLTDEYNTNSLFLDLQKSTKKD